MNYCRWNEKLERPKGGREDEGARKRVYNKTEMYGESVANEKLLYLHATYTFTAICCAYGTIILFHFISFHFIHTLSAHYHTQSNDILIVCMATAIAATRLLLGCCWCACIILCAVCNVHTHSHRSHYSAFNQRESVWSSVWFGSCLSWRSLYSRSPTISFHTEIVFGLLCVFIELVAGYVQQCVYKRTIHELWQHTHASVIL